MLRSREACDLPTLFPLLYDRAGGNEPIDAVSIENPIFDLTNDDLFTLMVLYNPRPVFIAMLTQLSKTTSRRLWHLMHTCELLDVAWFGQLSHGLNIKSPPGEEVAVVRVGDKIFYRPSSLWHSHVPRRVL